MNTITRTLTALAIAALASLAFAAEEAAEHVTQRLAFHSDGVLEQCVPAFADDPDLYTFCFTLEWVNLALARAELEQAVRNEDTLTWTSAWERTDFDEETAMVQRLLDYDEREFIVAVIGGDAPTDSSYVVVATAREN